jgi:hypothetical protein
MRKNLAIMIRPAPDAAALWFYLSGQKVLELVSEAVATYELQAVKVPPNVYGSPANPLVLAKPTFWMSAAVAMRNYRDSDFHVKVAGRLLKKWRGEKSGGFADGYYMSDVALSGTVKKEGEVWSRQEGASYREFAKFMASCMPKGNELAWSEDIADRMRKIMRYEVDLSGKTGENLFSAMPLLASVMFMTESSRNPRAWLMAHMMLDSIGQQYSRPSATSPKAKYYTWDRVLAHPERVDPGYSGKASVDKPQQGPTGLGGRTGKTPTGLGGLARKEDLASVEGKLPASPSGSSQTGKTIDVANDYIQMKETSLAIRWLARVLSLKHPDMDVIFVTWPAEEPLDGLTDLMSDTGLQQMAGKAPCTTCKLTLFDLKKFRTDRILEMKKLLLDRCATFDKM